MMNDAEFYIEDLKIKFDKINPSEYFLDVSIHKEYSAYDALGIKFLLFFIRNNDIPVNEYNVGKKLKSIYGGVLDYKDNEIYTCFDDKKNFYPLHDLPHDLLIKLINTYCTGRKAMPDKSIKLNSFGMNNKITANKVPEEKMREVGFTDYDESSWYFCKTLDKKNDITFNVSIKKDNLDSLHIFVLDENYAQHYDYQHILENYPDDFIANHIKNEVEKWMKYLQDNKIISGHSYGEYI